MNNIELRNLAVSFHVNSPNLRHGGVWDAISSLGGDVAIHYGRFLEISSSHKNKSARARNQIAILINRKAEGKV
jgi:hypothetical protein